MSEPAAANPSGTARICLLGEPVVCLPEGRRWPLERHDAALLALVVLEGPQPRAGLAQLLWPDVDINKALTSLRQRLYRLRRDSGHLLVSGDGPVQLADGVAHDLQPADWAAAGGDFQLLGACNYPEGEPLSERVTALRERWQMQRSEAIEQAADRLEAGKDFDAALQLAERLLVGRPASEHAHRRCMRLHYLRGDRAQALLAYARCRDRLRSLVGVQPDEETDDLARLIASGSLPGRDARWASPRVALAKPPRLVGRERVWSLLQDACGQHITVLLRGEAGIGKSRLATEFAQARGAALVVRAHAGERLLPFALLDRLLHEAGAAAAHAPGWAAPALAAALAPWARRRGASLVIDDVQWADSASLELLLAWLRSAAPARPAVLLCLRDGAMPPVLDDWLQAQHADGVLDLPLGPLDAAGVGDLLASLQLPSIPPDQLDDAATALLHQTGGHPHVLLELLRARPDAWARQPRRDGDRHSDDKLRAMLVQRIAHLQPEVQSLARVAALAGAAFSMPLAASVLALDTAALADSWRAFADAQLLQHDGEMFDTVREAVLQGVPAALAAATHLRIAGWLAAQGGRPDVIAPHWKAAGCWAPAAACFTAAARAALADARRFEELAFWDEAAACHERAGQSADAWDACRAALAAALVVESGQVLQQRIDAMAARASDDGMRLDVLLARSRALLNANQGAAALAPSQAALALAGQLADTRRAVAAAGWHGLALAMAERVDAGLALLRSHAAAALQTDDLRTRLDFFGSLGYAQHLAGDYADALDAIGSAAALAEQLGDLGEAIEQVANLSTCLNSLGRQADAIAQGERAIALWRRLGEPKSVTAAAIQVQLAATFCGDGRFQEAINLLDWALQCFRTMQLAGWQVTAGHRLAVAYLRLGQPARRPRRVVRSGSADGHPLHQPAHRTRRGCRRRTAALLDEVDRSDTRRSGCSRCRSRLPGRRNAGRPRHPPPRLPLARLQAHRSQPRPRHVVSSPGSARFVVALRSARRGHGGSTGSGHRPLLQYRRHPRRHLQPGRPDAVGMIRARTTPASPSRVLPTARRGTRPQPWRVCLW